MQNRPRVVVIGAGFGGMQAAQSLSKSNANVLLIDQNDYHTFIPLLYQVAAAQLEPELIAYPLRTVLHRRPNLRFLMAKVNHVNATHQIVETDNSMVSYDYLVLATGSRVKFLGVPGARDYAFTLKSLDDAVSIRNHLLSRLEQVTRESDPLRREHLLTVVTVGGGATGVEVAGTLVEMKRSLQRDYPDLNLREMQIVLVQSGETLLPDLPRRLGHYAVRKLRRMGVTVHLQRNVTRILPDRVEFQDGGSLSVGTVIWSVGLEATLPSMDATLETAHRNKVIVRSTLQLHHYCNVYAIGDLAYVEMDGKPLTGVAPEALQQGVAIARNIKRQLRGQAPKSFRYFNKGRLAIIGDYSGVGKVGPFILTGFLPWLMWLVVHVAYLPGFRSRLMVMVNWLYSYGLGRRPVRIISPSGSDKHQQWARPSDESAKRPDE